MRSQDLDRHLDELIDGHQLTYRLARVEHLLEQRLDHALGRVGLTLRQFTVLAHVAQTPGATRTEVARRLLTTPQAVGGLVQRLVAAGLVKRDSNGPGLPVGLTLTSAGTLALRRATPIVRQTENDAVSIVGEEERRHVEDVLDRLVEALCR